MRDPHSRRCHISSSSWGFVLDLRKRERIAARKQDLDTAVAAVGQAFGALSPAVQAFSFAFLPNAAISVEPPNVARAEGTENGRGLELDNAARARMLGRRGDLSRDEATVQVRHMPPAPRPSE